MTLCHDQQSLLEQTLTHGTFTCTSLPDEFATMIFASGRWRVFRLVNDSFLQMLMLKSRKLCSLSKFVHTLAAPLGETATHVISPLAAFSKTISRFAQWSKLDESRASSVTVLTEARFQMKALCPIVHKQHTSIHHQFSHLI